MNASHTGTRQAASGFFGAKTIANTVRVAKGFTISLTTTSRLHGPRMLKAVTHTVLAVARSGICSRMKKIMMAAA